MTIKQAFQKMQKLYPERTVSVSQQYWYHNIDGSSYCDCRATIFEPNSSRVCESFKGATLEECLEKVAEYERGKSENQGGEHE